MVWTKIWEDEWFQSLSDHAQKLFLYLITNSRIGISGCYEVTDRTIMFDTRIKDLDKVKAELHPKVRFYNGWINVVNAQGYNGFTGKSNEKALENELKLIPKEVKDALFSEKGYTPPTESPRPSKEGEKVEKKYSKREDLSEDDFNEIADKYKVPLAFVMSKLDDMINWEDEKPGRMKGRNWRATLMNWVKRDSLSIKQEYAKRNNEVSI